MVRKLTLVSSLEALESCVCTSFISDAPSDRQKQAIYCEDREAVDIMDAATIN